MSRTPTGIIGLLLTWPALAESFNEAQSRSQLTFYPVCPKTIADRQASPVLYAAAPQTQIRWPAAVAPNVGISLAPLSGKARPGPAIPFVGFQIGIAPGVLGSLAVQPSISLSALASP